MKTVRIIALTLCAAMLFATLAGCSEQEAELENEPTPTEQAPVYIPPGEIAPEEDREHVHGVDYGFAFEAFEPDTLMLSFGDFEVTWAELFIFLHNAVRDITTSLGGAPLWTDNIGIGMTYADVVISYALEDISVFKAIEHGAVLNGVTLSRDDFLLISENIDFLRDSLGSEEELLRVLWDYNGIYSLELFETLQRAEHLANNLMSKLYGEGGELLTDEDLEALIDSNEYMMAKHILIVKTDNGDPLAEIEDVLYLLNSYDGDDFEAFFGELMFEFSEDDAGLVMHPYGYLFQHGDMIQEFYDACTELEIGQMSGIIESNHGYHIILRLPLNFDLVPFGLSMMGDNRTLRQIAVAEKFELALAVWKEDIAPEFTDAFEMIDISALFLWCAH